MPDQPTPIQRVEQARNHLGLAQLKISHAGGCAMRGSDLELLAERIGQAQHELNRVTDVPERQRSEAEIFFAGASLGTVVELVLDAAHFLPGPGRDQLVDDVQRDLSGSFSEAELQRMIAPDVVTQAGLPRPA